MSQYTTFVAVRGTQKKFSYKAGRHK